MESAMDLSLRNTAPSPPMHLINPITSPSSTLPKLPLTASVTGGQILRPTPRPPWSIMWYQNLWSVSSSPGQIKPKSESDCEGSSKSNTVLRSNERSSFSVLNNLTTNTVNNCASASSCNFPYSISHEQQRIFQLPTSINETIPMATSSSVFKSKQQTDTMVSFQNQRNFTTDQEEFPRNDYSSEDDNDSDNSENIVVTSTSSFPTGLERKSINKSSSSCSSDKPDFAASFSSGNQEHHQSQQTSVILDIACCDGPVQFKRISNPNFALTVEHNEVCPQPFPVTTRKTVSVSNDTAQYQQQHLDKYELKQAEQSCASTSIADVGNRFHLPILPNINKVEDGGEDLNSPNATASTAVTTHKSYLCIYCNQSFKSLFCYQKHKKRHLNPVSVDITTTTANSTSYRGSGSSHKKGNLGGGVSTGGCGGGGGDGAGGGGGVNIGIIPENAKAKTKDLNVQFFPCKKCGCKFPSYYFVHKHRKICH